ncbi:hypothetical protein F0261_17920 [Alteromonas sp. 07-89-2]|mgnify:FL=1|uniref:hypothetical protein n=1 Tax=unclassified Alteromonas TaxID=2614992 RepID=UPI00148CA127|nr:MULTISPECIES: hypothetical protein [unclassified Alteromonas]MCG7639685.1 hypothetical protein [Alteromonas sp. CNT1-28]MCG7811623.1 hypothetical protein [Alteromonas sp. MCA-1]NOH59906.1 hypothetical protein [Alteromonas sp. 07-89-2]
MNTSKKLCDIGQLERYLFNIGESEILEYITEESDAYVLSDEFYSRNIDQITSIKLQLAACFAVLGQPEIADKLAPLSWEILSREYDKVANGIVSEFTQSWPRIK